MSTWAQVMSLLKPLSLSYQVVQLLAYASLECIHTFTVLCDVELLAEIADLSLCHLWHLVPQ